MVSVDERVCRLKSELRDLARLGSVLGLLEWDHQVLLPKGAQSLRAGQIKAMTEVVHRARTRPELGELIASLEQELDTLTEVDRVIVKDAARQYRRHARIPESFAAHKAERQSAAYEVWLAAREARDYEPFASCLQEQVDLCIEESQYVGSHANPYDFWLDTFDPGLDAASVERLLRPLGEAIRGMVPVLVEAQRDRPPFPGGCFDVTTQRSFLKEVVGRLGFDFDHGRIDESVHPFCSGTGQDIRMTTRFAAENPLDSLYSAIHEAGHAMYEQGLPVEHLGNALGSSVGMAVHESQSRLWENQVARSEAFWQYWGPRYRECFPAQMQHVNECQWLDRILEVKPSPIRVEADEVTYHLHVLIRFELEQALLQGRLPAADLAEAWNDAYERHLGFRPEDDRQGVLQDVHWASGAFGYFPSYSIGTMISAQLWDSMLKETPDLVKKIKKGNFLSIFQWLRTHVHGLGRRYPTQELVKVATGHELSAAPLIRYLEEKYYGHFGVAG